MTIVSLGPCPPEEFSGRHRERENILSALSCAKNRGQVILISGATGSGKSSLLHWVAEEIQKLGEPEYLVITKEFYDTPGMGFKIYRDLLKDLQGHTKYGRFRVIIGSADVIKSLNTALNLLETFTSVTEPVGTLIRIAKAIVGADAPPQKIEYEDILSSILTVFQEISTELEKNDRLLVILLDDVQWSSEPDFRLLKDLIRNVPQNVAFLLTYRREDRTNQMYEELMGELNRWDQTEIPLYQLDSAGIEDFATRRYDLSLDDSSARYLEEKVGDPLSLVVCFNLLQRKGLSPDIDNLETILPEVLERPAKSFLSGLDQPSRDRVNLLCILKPPIPFSVIACLTETAPQEAARLQSDLDSSIAFRRIKHGLYDFGHSSLREYCRRELPDIQELELHRLAAKCFGNLIDKLPDKQYVLLSLAEHAFYGEDYQTAFDLNFVLGYEAYAHYDHSTAFELMKRAKISAELLHDRDNLAAVYHHLGMVFQVLYRHSEALDNYTRALAIKRDLGDREGEAGTLHQIGIVYQKTHRYDDALECYNQSLAISQDLGNRRGEIKTLYQIGTMNQEMHRYDEALECYNQSLAISRKLGNQEGEAITLHQVGVVYQEMHQHDDALNYYNQSLTISQKLGNRGGEARTLRQVGVVYQEMHRYDDALDRYNQSLAIERKLGNQEGEARTLHLVGMAYEEMRRYDNALECYNQSLAIGRKIGNRENDIRTLHQIGNVYLVTHRYGEALNYYNQSLAISRELGNQGGKVTTLHQIGMTYQKMHRYDDALECYTRALVIKRELGNWGGEAITLHLIGMVHQEMHQYDEALSYYNQSLAISRELDNRNNGEALTLAQIAALHLARSDFDESIRCYGTAFSIAMEHQTLPFIAIPIILKLAIVLNEVGDERFTAIWQKAFDGADPPLDLIREIERQFEAETD